MTLRSKLLILCIGAGTVPTGFFAWRANQNVKIASEEAARGFHRLAMELADKYNRALFERYGDAQAFALNPLLQNQDVWGKVGAENNPIVKAANRYGALYGMYPLMIVTDKEGRVIAVNDLDAGGRKIAVEYLYGKNFRNAPWFQAIVSRGGTFQGTWIEDAHRDEDVARVYGSHGLTVGFSAPVVDAEGRLIGVWSNRANLEFFEGILMDAQTNLAKTGFDTAELTLLDKQGRIVAEYNPAFHQKKAYVRDLDKAILKLNLAQSGVAAAEKVVQGEDGLIYSRHKRKQIMQASAFSPLRPFPGFPGIGWSVLVRVDESVIRGPEQRLAQEAWMLFGATAVILGLVGWLWSRWLSQPIEETAGRLRDLISAVSLSTQELANCAGTLADDSSRQAASVEETSASMQHLAAWTVQNQAHAEEASKTAGIAQELTGDSQAAIGQVSTSISEVEKATGQIEGIAKMIREIAMQTHLLSLNASVEAARAGENGLGFAVVAQEVRSLADRASASSREASALVEEAARASRSAAGGLQVARKSSVETLDRIRDVHQLVSEVGDQTAVQSANLQSAQQALRSIENITLQNAGRAEESAQACVVVRGEMKAAETLVANLDTVLYGRRHRVRN